MLERPLQNFPFDCVIVTPHSEGEHFKGLSFETISAVGAHAAMAHYSPTAETATRITRSNVYLVDSGGQYLDGTTDITRTVHFGQPTIEQRDSFTRDLKGFIALSTTVFPRGVDVSHISMVNRRFGELVLCYKV